MSVFNRKFSGKGPFRVSAIFMTDVARMLDNIKVYGPGRAVETKKKIALYIEPSFPWPNIPFGYSITDGTALTILPGALDYCVPGGAYLVESSTSVTLSGSPAWVYLKKPRAGSTASV